MSVPSQFFKGSKTTLDVYDIAFDSDQAVPVPGSVWGYVASKRRRIVFLEESEASKETPLPISPFASRGFSVRVRLSCCSSALSCSWPLYVC